MGRTSSRDVPCPCEAEQNQTPPTNFQRKSSSYDPLFVRLICPICATSLVAGEGGFICHEHGVFPDKDGIVVFQQKGSVGFDQHWDDTAGVGHPAAKLIVARRFLRPLMRWVKEHSSRNLSCLDVGCGNGVHIALLQNEIASLSVAGLDISYSALQAAVGMSTGWFPIHADAQRIPFADESFDATFSYGVLAYLSDPWQGLREMVRVTKAGGLIGVWFYPRSEGLSGAVLAAVRSIVPRLPRSLQLRAADAIVPFLGILPTASSMSLRNSTWQACREVILVNIAPPKLLLPTRAEVEQRLLALGCVINDVDGCAPLTIWVRKHSNRCSP